MPRVAICLVALLLAWAPHVQAAVVCTQLGTPIGVTTNASSYATNSISPTANALQLLFVVNTKASAPDLVNTVTGQSLTWVSVVTGVMTSDDARMTIFRAMGASPTTGALTIDFNAVNQTGIAVKQIECTGTDTSGTNGSGAIVQSPACNAAASATTNTFTFAAYGSASNAAVAAFTSKTATQTFTAEMGWTDSGTTEAYASPNTTVGAMWQNAATDTTALGTFGAAATSVSCGVEVKIAGAASATPRGTLLGVLP